MRNGMKKPWGYWRDEQANAGRCYRAYVALKIAPD
jgi:hypothetical protein